MSQVQVEAPAPNSQLAATKPPKKRNPAYEKIPKQDHVIRFSGFTSIDDIRKLTKKMIKSMGMQKPGDYTAELIDSERIKLSPSAIQQKEKKRKYRETYRMKPEVVLKQHQNATNPEVKAKQKEYAKKPEIVVKKRIQSQERRGIPSIIKSIDPLLYEEALQKSRERIQKKKEDFERKQRILQDHLRKANDDSKSTDTSDTSSSEEGDNEPPLKKQKTTAEATCPKC